MSRRCAIVSLLALLCALGCRPATRPPNIVIYLVDTLRADHLGVYGYARDTSPRLDAFARDAVVYRRAYSPSSWTRPAVASLLSGLHPLRHGAVSRASALEQGVRLLGGYLADAGYQTAAFVTNPNVLPVWGFGRGFETFHDVESVALSGRADRVNEVVFEYLAGSLEEPFFLYIHTRDPHTPYDPPPAWRHFGALETGARPIDLYDDEIRFNDHHFGKLLDHLDERGLGRRSMLVFTSDHGEEFGERGGSGHGFTLFEEVVRVPLVVRYPGNANAGSSVDAPVSLLDVMPTVLAMAGLEAPPGVEGRDLRSRPNPERPLFFALDLVTGDRHAADAVLLGGWKLLEGREPRPSLQLFDLVADPEERHSLIGRESARSRELGGLLDGFRAGAQSGLHVHLVNRAGVMPRPAEVVLTTTGRFLRPRAVQLEQGDAVELEAGGQRLRLRAQLLNVRNPIGQYPPRIVDIDGFVVQVEPPDAVVEIEPFEIGGEAGQIRLGGALTAADPGPVSFRIDAGELQVARMDAPRVRGPGGERLSRPGLYVARVEGPEGREIEIEGELEERLRRLGYLQ